MSESKDPAVKLPEPKTKIKAEAYYTTKNKKVVDFLIGFLGAPAAVVIAARFIPDVAAVVFLLMLVLSAMAFAKGRRFIGLGILIAIVAVPLIVFGSCLAILGGFGR